jgi:hypothetical protein
MALLSTVETCSVSNLSWCCLTVLLVCWGRKTRCLLILPLELTSSSLIVLDSDTGAEDTAFETAIAEVDDGSA